MGTRLAAVAGDFYPSQLHTFPFNTAVTYLLAGVIIKSSFL